jgi:hypothetical protein
MITPEVMIWIICSIVGLVLIGFLYQWLTGEREEGPARWGAGFYRAPKAPEDEWKKWSKL